MENDNHLMPREKLLKLGVASLSDRELLAIFLRTGYKGCPVMLMAKNVLDEFGSLRALLSANKERFCTVKGLGITQFIQLQASKEMTRRYLNQSLELTEQFYSPESVRLFVQSELEHYEREVFFVLFLNNQHRLLKKEVMFQGTINRASVHPREIIKQALAYNAAALILAHNHPSGISEPSDADRQLTQHIQEACQLVDIKLLDHIVVGHGSYCAFSERGWL